MHFQLFVPRARGCDPGILSSIGLADFVAGAEFMDSAEGPIGGGAVIAWRKPGQAQMGFRKGEQEWIAAVPRDGLPAERYYVGFWNNDLPTPKDLMRPYRQPGHTLSLGDGNGWIVPVAKELPAEMVLADDGTWRFDVQRRFHEFYLEYLDWLQLFGTSQEGDTFSYSKAADFILSALRINYRVLPEVASRLHLFGTENVEASLLAIMGIKRPPVPVG